MFSHHFSVITIINQVINDLGRVVQLCEEAKTAEEARVPALRAQAAKLFTACYADFNATQTVVNAAVTPLCGSKEHGELHLLLAEAALYTDNNRTSRLVVERFLQTGPQQNQYYCRAKLLLGQLADREAALLPLTGAAAVRARKEAVAAGLQAFAVANPPENVARTQILR